MYFFVGSWLLRTESQRGQFLPAEQEQRYDTYADAGIGEVEDWTEEDELLASDKRHPLRPRGDDEREVEHIDHLACQKS